MNRLNEKYVHLIMQGLHIQCREWDYDGFREKNESLFQTLIGINYFRSHSKLHCNSRE